MLSAVLAWEQVDEHAIQAASADVIIVDANAPGRDTLEQISLMSTTLEKPVVVLGARNDQESIPRGDARWCQCLCVTYRSG